MLGKWTRHWMVALVLAAAGITIACTDESISGPSEPAAEADTETGLQLVPGGSLLSSANCVHNPHPLNVNEVFGTCTELYGPGLTLTATPPNGGPALTSFACTSWGDPGPPFSFYGGNASYNEVSHNTAPGGVWLHPFTAGSNHAFIQVTQVSPEGYSFTVTPKHPTAPGQYIRITCSIDGHSAFADFTVNGTVPVAVNSITGIGGPEKMGVNQVATFSVANYVDNYNFTNAIQPAPAFDWSSSNPAVAEVHPTTGVVTAKATGTATITATNNGKTGSKLVTVSKCTGVSLSPSALQSLAYGQTPIAAVATPTGCASGVSTSQQPFQWSATPGGVVTVTPVAFPAQSASINPNVNGGSTIVKACLNYTPTPVCASVTVNVSRVVITSYYDGSVFNVQPGASSEAHFDVRNTGTGTTPSFTMACSSTGSVTCNGTTIQPSPTTLGSGQFHQLFVPFTASTTPGPGTIRLTANGQTHTVNVNVSNTTGNPVAVDMTQYQEAARGVTCTWTATPSGGTTPYANYEWTIDGTPMGTNSPTFTYTTPTKAMITSFNIGVTVTDALGATGSTSNTITLLSSGTGCYY